MVWVRFSKGWGLCHLQRDFVSHKIMCCFEQVSNNMSTIKKRKCSNHDEQENEREQSSYAKMKLKLEQMRMELMETQVQKAEIEVALDKVRMEQYETHRNERGSSKGGQSSYAKVKMQMKRNHEKLAQVQMELQDTQRIKSVCDDELVQVRSELQETHRKKCEFEAVVHLVRTELEELTMRNEEMNEEIKELKRGMGLRWLHMERLKATITEGTIRYDAMVARVEQYERTTEQQRVEKCKHKRKHTTMAVCRAFGWSLQNLDPILFRAACGFWDATTFDAGNKHRASVKMREDIWYQLTCLGFKGKVLQKMENGWKKLHKFDVVELARRSDVDSRFNSMSLSAVAHCQRGMRKYERGLLCSGATLRRTQKQVLDLATSVRFSSFPTHDNGNV